MARINIEEKWWSDHRRTLMEARYGCTALSKVVTAWQIAAWYSLYKNTHLIKKQDISVVEGWEYLLNIGLIKDIDADHVYVCGSSQYFPLNRGGNGQN